jgi:hypothetical protein
VRWHPEAQTEAQALRDPRDREAIAHAVEKLEVEGVNLSHPHQSAIRGSGRGLRELRPRGGRSAVRPLYTRFDRRTFVILAIAPEAQSDRRGFNAALRRASRRFNEIHQ